MAEKRSINTTPVQKQLLSLVVGLDERGQEVVQALDSLIRDTGQQASAMVSLDLCLHSSSMSVAWKEGLDQFGIKDLESRLYLSPLFQSIANSTAGRSPAVRAEADATALSLLRALLQSGAPRKSARKVEGLCDPVVLDIFAYDDINQLVELRDLVDLDKKGIIEDETGPVRDFLIKILAFLALVARDTDGWTLLHWAAQNNAPSVFEQILKTVYDLLNDCLEILDRQMSPRARKKDHSVKTYTDSKINGRMTELDILERVKILRNKLDRRWKLFCTSFDTDGQTPFHVAAYHGSWDVLEWAYNLIPSDYDIGKTKANPAVSVWQSEFRLQAAADLFWIVSKGNPDLPDTPIEILFYRGHAQAFSKAISIDGIWSKADQDHRVRESDAMVPLQLGHGNGSNHENPSIFLSLWSGEMDSDKKENSLELMKLVSQDIASLITWNRDRMPSRSRHVTQRYEKHLLRKAITRLNQQGGREIIEPNSPHKRERQTSTGASLLAEPDKHAWLITGTEKYDWARAIRIMEYLEAWDFDVTVVVLQDEDSTSCLDARDYLSRKLVKGRNLAVVEQMRFPSLQTISDYEVISGNKRTLALRARLGRILLLNRETSHGSMLEKSQLIAGAANLLQFMAIGLPSFPDTYRASRQLYGRDNSYFKLDDTSTLQPSAEIFDPARTDSRLWIKSFLSEIEKTGRYYASAGIFSMISGLDSLLYSIETQVGIDTMKRLLDVDGEFSGTGTNENSRQKEILAISERIFDWTHWNPFMKDVGNDSDAVSSRQLLDHLDEQAASTFLEDHFKSRSRPERDEGIFESYKGLEPSTFEKTQKLDDSRVERERLAHQIDSGKKFLIKFREIPSVFELRKFFGFVRRIRENDIDESGRRIRSIIMSTDSFFRTNTMSVLSLRLDQKSRKVREDIEEFSNRICRGDSTVIDVKVKTGDKKNSKEYSSVVIKPGFSNWRLAARALSGVRRHLTSSQASELIEFAKTTPLPFRGSEGKGNYLRSNLDVLLDDYGNASKRLSDMAKRIPPFRFFLASALAFLATSFMALHPSVNRWAGPILSDLKKIPVDIASFFTKGFLASPLVWTTLFSVLASLIFILLSYGMVRLFLNQTYRRLSILAQQILFSRFMLYDEIVLFRKMLGTIDFYRRLDQDLEALGKHFGKLDSLLKEWLETLEAISDKTTDAIHSGPGVPTTQKPGGPDAGKQLHGLACVLPLIAEASQIDNLFIQIMPDDRHRESRARSFIGNGSILSRREDDEEKSAEDFLKDNREKELLSQEDKRTVAEQVLRNLSLRQKLLTFAFEHLNKHEIFFPIPRRPSLMFMVSNQEFVSAIDDEFASRRMYREPRTVCTLGESNRHTLGLSIINIAVGLTFDEVRTIPSQLEKN